MSETQKSVADWINETFGPATSSLRGATRANEEMAELLACLSVDEKHPKAAEEAADVTIVLCRLAEHLKCQLEFHETFFQATFSKQERVGFANEWLAITIQGIIQDMNPRDVGERLKQCVKHLASLEVLLGTTLQAEIDRKMQINRNRQWKLDGSGCGYHVKPS